MSFGEKLKQARTRKGLTQRELAEIMKVSKNTILAVLDGPSPQR